MLSHENIIKYPFDLSFILIDGFKNILSCSHIFPRQLELLFRKLPQIGASIGEVIPQCHVDDISKLIDNCLLKNNGLADYKHLLHCKITSSKKDQVLFIPIPISRLFNCVVCLFVTFTESKSESILQQELLESLYDNQNRENDPYHYGLSKVAEKINADPLSATNTCIETLTNLTKPSKITTSITDNYIIPSMLTEKLRPTYPKEEVSFAIEKMERKCSYCKSLTIERIPRGRFVRNVFFWLRVKRYICYHCMNKFYVKT